MTTDEIFVEEISICDEYSNRPQELVCRTCTKTNNRFWAHDPVAIVKSKTDGSFDESELSCYPTKVWNEVKVLNTLDHYNRIVELDKSSYSKTLAYLSTCGHEIRKQCYVCENFLPIEVDVAIPSDNDKGLIYRPVKKGNKTFLEPFNHDGSLVRKQKVAIGGSCTLPVRGIKRGNETVYCEFKPRGKRIESPSCANCYYLDNAGEKWQFNYLEINDNASLTPWEEEQALKAAENSDASVGQILGLALWKKQTEGHGRILSFPVQILRKDYHQGELKYKIRFKANNVTAIVGAFDPTITIDSDVEIGYNYSDSAFKGTFTGIAYIMYPFHKTFELPDNLKIVKRKWPQLPEKIEIANPIWDELVDEACPRCNIAKNKPCYYHSKRPRYNFVKGIVEFTVGRQVETTHIFPPHGILHIEKRFGHYVAVDGNGNLPEPYSDDKANAAVFRLYLPELLRMAKAKYGKKAADDIFNQYNKVTSLLHYSSPVKVRPSWLRTSCEEPSKPRCTNPDGLNLRKVFMDSFGSERTDIDFDLGAYNTAIVEEELRVGKRQHSQTVQRLHEEILATITSHPRYREEIGGVITSDVEWPAEMTTTKIEAVGGMYDVDGNPITSTSEFVSLLDEEISIGNFGDSERNITVRQQLFGYQLARGYYGKRKGHEKTSMPAFDNEFAIFEDHGESDQIDVNDSWRCVHCSRYYDQSEIENWFSPTCECGHALYKNHTSRVSYNARATGGIGNALAMDNDSMRQRQMLYATLCPKWRLNVRNAHITLDDIAGSKKDANETPVTIKQSGPIVHKVGGFLSEEHIAANKEYEDKRQEVYAQREQFKEQYPDITIEELEAKFPLPYGIIYVEKAAGSLAKMGGV